MRSLLLIHGPKSSASLEDPKRTELGAIALAEVLRAAALLMDVVLIPARPEVLAMAAVTARALLRPGGPEGAHDGRRRVARFIPYDVPSRGDPLEQQTPWSIESADPDQAAGIEASDVRALDDLIRRYKPESGIVLEPDWDAVEALGTTAPLKLRCFGSLLRGGFADRLARDFSVQDLETDWRFADVPDPETGRVEDDRALEPFVPFSILLQSALIGVIGG
ncbi:hypothetical protein [Dongia sedimenti]|uniref:Uncharacterized protein n=1 Tax=Dongia sedimenti TaxID=3064282 RepID=A0ABU0YWA4_9PROT|nr:hypothetical protein [Rhodospirillaceae bacterium R-7]